MVCVLYAITTHTERKREEERKRPCRTINLAKAIIIENDLFLLHFVAFRGAFSCSSRVMSVMKFYADYVNTKCCTLNKYELNERTNE